jgi:hypothetical protein
MNLLNILKNKERQNWEGYLDGVERVAGEGRGHAPEQTSHEEGAGRGDGRCGHHGSLHQAAATINPPLVVAGRHLHSLPLLPLPYSPSSPRLVNTPHLSHLTCQVSQGVYVKRRCTTNRSIHSFEEMQKMK